MSPCVHCSFPIVEWLFCSKMIFFTEIIIFFDAGLMNSIPISVGLLAEVFSVFFLGLSSVDMRIDLGSVAVGVHKHKYFYTEAKATITTLITAERRMLRLKFKVHAINFAYKFRFNFFYTSHL